MALQRRYIRRPRRLHADLHNDVYDFSKVLKTIINDRQFFLRLKLKKLWRDRLPALQNALMAPRMRPRKPVLGTSLSTNDAQPEKII